MPGDTCAALPRPAGSPARHRRRRRPSTRAYVSTRFEQRPLVAPVLHHRDRLRRTVAGRSPPVQFDQPMRPGERHRVQQQAVVDGEYHPGHGDAEVQDDDHGDSSGWCASLTGKDHPEVAVPRAGRL